ncbi:hypothetical protein M728_005615 (plasmid) [Ensifer sp. WSM1721]
MRVCGIKLTHGGAIALVENGRLVPITMGVASSPVQLRPASGDAFNTVR